MDEVLKMLSILIEGQHQLRADMKGMEKRLGKRMDVLEKRMDKVEKRMDALEKRMGSMENHVDGLEKEMRGGFTQLHARIDRFGCDLAYLYDDAPTREEFEILEKKVHHIEIKLA